MVQGQTLEFTLGALVYSPDTLSSVYEFLEQKARRWNLKMWRMFLEFILQYCGRLYFIILSGPPDFHVGDVLKIGLFTAIFGISLDLIITDKDR
jgi:hypothetical protein